ncbi:TPA: N-acetyltransferase family protein [Streptococcus pneumoniae]
MEIRLAFPNEVDAIMQVMEDAKKCLADAGSDQWQNGYPNADVIIDDIISGQAYVALEEGELLAYAAVTADVQGKGVAQTFLEGLIEGFDYLDFRSDTHAENKVMQHIFEKLGFKQVGKVPVDGERLAYQKLKK